jgi:signal transduction histidine kinase/ligand-binding sensor domain-containing protein/CheY-like chemotaxis protein
VVAALVAGLVALAPRAWAHPEDAGRDVELRSWQIEQGLPQNTVNDIKQDANHHLWLATFGGLARFDGNRFTTFDLASDQGLPTNRLLSLEVHPEGGLLVGTQDAGLLRFDGERFTPVPVSGLPADALINDIDRAGDHLWAASTAGLIDVTRRQLLDWSDGTPTPALSEVLIDREGTVWFGGHFGLGRVVDGQPTKVRSHPPVDGMIELPDGRLVLHSWRGVHRVENPTAPAAELEITTLATEDLGWASDTELTPQGELWLTGSSIGLALVEEDGLHSLRSTTSIKALRGRALHTDAHGTVWLGTVGDGLYRLRKRRVERWSSADGLPEEVRSVLHLPPAMGGGMLATGRSPSIVRWRQGAAEPLEVDLPLPRLAYALAVEDEDSVLVAVQDDTEQGVKGAVWRLEPGRTGFRATVLCAGLPMVPGALLPVRDSDAVWVGTEQGLGRCAEGQLEPIAELAGVSVLAITRQGERLLIGTRGGVAVWTPGRPPQWLRAGETPGMIPGAIRSVFVDPEGLAWFGSYGGGLALWDGTTVASVSAADGLHENAISGIVLDSSDRLMLSGNRGISVVQRQAVVDAARSGVPIGQIMLLPGGEVAGGTSPVSSISPEGELWSTTITGAARVPPGELDRPTGRFHGPRVSIDLAQVDGETIQQGELAPPGEHHSLYVQLSVDSLESPGEVVYRHRLKGLDMTWKPLSGSVVEYPHLPPGRYELEVQALSTLSPLRAPPTVFSFGIQRALWQQWWFGYALFGLVSGIGALGFALRLRTARAHSRALHLEIRQRESVQQALREREELYRTVFQGSTTGLLIYRDASVVEAVNPEAGRLLGLPPTTRDQPHPLLPHVLREAEQSAVAEALQAAAAQSRPPAVEVRWRVDDGEPARVQLHCWSIPGHEGRRLLVALDDVTALRRSQALQSEMKERIHRAQTVEALGQLAGETAHDFNNLLTVVMANATMLCADDVEEPQELAEDILQTCTRATLLVRRMLALGQRQSWEDRSVDLVRFLRDLQPVLRASLPTDIVLELRSEVDDLWVSTDPAFLERSLLNLLINARDAMPDGGTIEIALEEVMLDAAAVEQLPVCRLDPGRVACIHVRDDGVGMDLDVQRQIFQPFFTTKDASDGTGLGLSSVRSFASRSGGAVGLVAHPGEGACFSLYLPLLEREDASGPTTELHTGPLEGPLPDQALAGWRILIVDDDAGVLRVCAMALEHAGATVLQTSDPLHGLELAIEEGASLDALVTDVVMPRLRGPALVERAREVHPSLPVLYMSGHTRGEVVRDAPLLGKPFRPSMLVAALLGMRQGQP